MKALLIFISVLFITADLQGQARGKAYIFINPQDAVIRLDTTLIKSRNAPFELNEGKYTIKVWAPKRQLLIDTLLVKPGIHVMFNKKLKYTKEYKGYREKLFLYRTAKILMYSGVPLSLAYTGNAWIKYAKYKRSSNENLTNAIAERQKYENAMTLSDLKTYKENYEIYKANYDNDIKKGNAIVTKAAIIAPLGFAVSTFLYITSKSLKKPAYTETPLLSLYDVSLQTDYKASLMIGLTLNLCTK